MTVDLARLTRTIRDLTNPHHDGQHHSPGLLVELQDPDVKILRSGQGGPIPTSKPGSRPPVDVAHHDLLVQAEARTWEHEADLLDAAPDPACLVWHERQHHRIGWLGTLHGLAWLASVIDPDHPALDALWADAYEWRGTARRLLGYTGRDHGDSICPSCQNATYVTAGGDQDEGYCLRRSCPLAADLRAATGELLDTHTACVALGIKPATLRDWKRQHLIRPAGGSVRRPLWKVEDLLRAKQAPKPRGAARDAKAS